MLNSGLRTKPLDLLMTKQKSISRTQFRGDLLICRPCLYRILLLKPILSSAHKTVHLCAAKASMLLCFPQKVSENKGWSWWSSPSPFVWMPTRTETRKSVESLCCSTAGSEGHAK